MTKWTVLAVLLTSLLSAGAIDVNKDSFAAIAYSPKTGKYVYVTDLKSRKSAEDAVRKKCDAPDTKIACWVNFGFIALALGDDKTYWGAGWTFGAGSNAKDAADRAIADGSNKTAGIHLALVLSSDGKFVWDQRDHAAGLGADSAKFVSPNPAPIASPSATRAKSKTRK